MHRFAILLTLTASVAIGAENKEKPDSADGTWIITAMEVGGAKVPDETIKQYAGKLTLNGDKWSLKMGNEVGAGTSKSDVTKKPAQLDITTTEGANKGQVIKAIVEREGDTMKACFDSSGGERPKEFSTKDKPTYVLVEYKREKK